MQSYGLWEHFLIEMEFTGVQPSNVNNICEIIVSTEIGQRQNKSISNIKYSY